MLVLSFFFLRILRPPRSTRTDTLFPYTTLFRSDEIVEAECGGGPKIHVGLLDALQQTETRIVYYRSNRRHDHHRRADRFAALQISASHIEQHAAGENQEHNAGRRGCAGLRTDETRVGKEGDGTCRYRW